MKNILLIIFIFLINIIKLCTYDIDILTKNIESKFLKIKLKNTGNKTLIFYYGDYDTQYNILIENNIEITGETKTLSSGEDYLDYQYDYSEALIKRTMKSYNIGFIEAIMYLHYKKEYIVLLPHEEKILDLPIITRGGRTSYKIDSSQIVYLNSNTIFSDKFIPGKIKDSLKYRKIEIINPAINVKKVKIDISKFFRKSKGSYIR